MGRSANRTATLRIAAAVNRDLAATQAVENLKGGRFVV